MKLAVADCSAIYDGRGNSTLPRGIRTLMIKNDGSVSIHSEKSNKPLNYMKGASRTESVNKEGKATWTFESKHEVLEVTIYELKFVSEVELMEDDPGTEMDGTERHLQEWISMHPEILGNGFTVIGREFHTGKGPVDILALDREGNPVAVEIKRIAMLGAVDQVRRYVDSIKISGQKIEPQEVGLFEPVSQDLVNEDGSPRVPVGVEINLEDKGIDLSKIRGMIAALDIRPKTSDWAAKHNIATITLPSDWKNNS
jgi:RecB family endonuclease NucS